MPAAIGITARKGPKNRPMKTLLPPKRLKRLTLRVRRSGCFLKGHIPGRKGPNFLPSQNDTESPSTAPTIPAATVGKGLRMPSDTNVPEAMRMAVPGNSRLRKANDDDEYRPFRVGLDKGQDLSSEIVHREPTTPFSAWFVSPPHDVDFRSAQAFKRSLHSWKTGRS